MLPKNVKLEETSITYAQEGDACSSSETQFLEIKTQDAGSGKYFVIETARWAFDNIDELLSVLNDFKSKVENNLE